MDATIIAGKAGYVVGVLLVYGFIVYITYKYWKRRKKKITQNTNSV
jgi:Ca2+/Na+ antiporter